MGELYRDATRPAEERAQDLLGRMTLEEKVRQMAQRDIGEFLRDGAVDPGALRGELSLGIGTLQDPRIDPQRGAAAVNAVQRFLVEETRLGIPGLVIAECLHGHMSDGATIFPQAIGLASTWNPELVARMAAATAKEARAVGVAQALAPDLDLARDPRWGRVEETYGEDPYLASRLGVAYVRGMQGEGPEIDREHLACTVKHYAAHGSPEAGVNLAPVAGSLRDLFTLYLPPFRAAVTEAGALSVMPAYSEFLDVPASQSKLLLTRILREAWGFTGYVYSDYSAIEMLHSFHRTAASPAEAGRLALQAGMDLEAPNDYGFGANLIELVRAGTVSESLVDQAVLRILRVKFLAGLFEQPYADPAAQAVVHAPAHRTLAREIARESIILLKNDGGVLPLSPDIRSLAVIGPNAATAQLGDYSRPADHAVSPLDGLRAALPEATIRYAKGCELYGTATDGFTEAVAAAQASDVALVVIGETSHALGGTGWGIDTGSATCGEGYDRTELTPSGMQEELVRAIMATGTPTVVVLVNGRPISSPWIAEHVPAIVEAWYPGEEGGHALAEILLGQVNPSGKLPITIPRSAGHVPAFYNHKPSARGYYHRPGSPEHPGRDYVFDTPAPLFPFGHGLSYTTFAYRDLRLEPAEIGQYGRTKVSVTVENTGDCAGQEVVQLYINDVVSSVTTPVKELRRFGKVALAPGEQATIVLTLTFDDLALLDEEMNRVAEPGEFEIMIGGLTAVLKVTE